MVRYVVVSIASGLLFGAMDGLINVNPYAMRLFEVYAPIARSSVNVAAGVLIDLVYGFVMAAMFLILYKSLPGRTALTKGLTFAAGAWFLRVAMSAASSWMMFDIPAGTLAYSLATGLAEMLILGILFGLTLKPRS